MKISDNELIHKIWINQLRLLSTGVLKDYMGGGVAICPDTYSSYERACIQWRVSRHVITTEISKAHLLKRISQLAADNKLTSVNNLFGFFIDSKPARRAFEIAREFYIRKGIPVSQARGTQRTLKIDKDILTYECEQLLLKFLGNFNEHQTHI